MTKFTDVKHMTTEEYFNGNSFSIDAFNKKYAIHPNETYVRALKRVCDYVSLAEETPELRRYWSTRWFDEIFNDWWHPAGSIMQGAGNPKKISLANCTTISLGAIDTEKDWDTLEGIIRGAAYTTAKAAAYRQGLGIDFSRLRPKNSAVHNSSNKSEGVIHWMKFIDSIGYYVGQKGRIPAMLFSLRGDHPDILDFIEVKKDFTQIQNANISVQLTDDFYKTVKKDGNWELKFVIPKVKIGDPIFIDENVKTSAAIQTDDGRWYVKAQHSKPKEVISHKIKARKLLNAIAKNMFTNAEPGIQNIDIARRFSNSDAVYDPKDSYDSRIISTNACSEQYLSVDSCCFLASINAGRFNIVNYISELEIIAPSINRFLDDVNTMELRDHKYATPLQAEAIRKLRRTGAGVTNLAEYIFKCDFDYGSSSGNLVSEDFIRHYNYLLYKSTIELGKEKGNYKLFDPKKIHNSAFIKRMASMERWKGQSTEEEFLVFSHMRNNTVSSIAPAGTLSLMHRNLILGSGIEPAFGSGYWKRSRIEGFYNYYFCVPKIIRDKCETEGIKLPMSTDTIKDDWEGTAGKKIIKILNENTDKIGLKSSRTISPLNKLHLVSNIARHIDSSVSVTFMLAENSSLKNVKDFIEKAHESELKSIAAFPDKKMYGIISFIPFKDLAIKIKEENIELHPQNFTENELKELNLATKNIVYSTAPKRPKELPAEIHSVTVKGKKFVVAVGLLNGIPYELFGGEMNGLRFTFSTKPGKLIKATKHKYRLEIEDGIEIDDFSSAFKPVEQTLFRMVSANLRHGTPVKFICEQLHKATDDMSSLTKAAARVLKKYISNGETAHGLECPQCGSTSLIYFEGCINCACGFSRCD